MFVRWLSEQVPAALPSPEKRKASVDSVKRKEIREPILHTSNQSKNWTAPENKSAESTLVLPVFSKDQKVEKKSNALRPFLLDKPIKENMKEEEFFPQETALVIAAAEEENREKMGEEDGDLGKDRRVGTVSSSREGVGLLQWGHRKRPRCSRADNHLKHSSLTDESFVLSRKMVRVKAERVSIAVGIAPKVAMEVKNRVVQRPRLPHPQVEVHASPEERRKRAKTQREGASGLAKVNRRMSEAEGKGACSLLPSRRKGIQPLHHSRMHPSLHHNKASHDTSIIANRGSREVAATKIELVDWPKILICLSRKEKEHDFLVLKGTKLPQRPERRPKAVEKALHFCTPGIWLTDLSRGRYDVREKKCVKEKPRGLKAMESLDSDSE